MLEERTFAQSMIFKNDTWLILGGQNSQGITLGTIEYMNSNEMIFESYSNMPENVAHHCAKMINVSHLFTTGGSKVSSLSDSSVSSRG